MAKGNLAALQKALDRSAKPAAPSPLPESEASPGPAGSYKAPSRENKMPHTAYLSPDYKTSLRLIQARDNRKGEARNALVRAICFHRLGRLRDRAAEAQQYRASGLALVTAAIALWNPVYLGRTLGTAPRRRNRPGSAAHPPLPSRLAAHQSHRRLSVGFSEQSWSRRPSVASHASKKPSPGCRCLSVSLIWSYFDPARPIMCAYAAMYSSACLQMRVRLPWMTSGDPLRWILLGMAGRLRWF